MTLGKFIDESGLADFSELDKVLYFALYYLKKDKVEEFTAGEAAKWISDNRMGAPNVARLKTNLAKSNSTVKGSGPGSFRLRHNVLKTFEGKFPQLSEKSQEVIDHGTILPPVAYENTRGYIVSLAKQINLSYESNIFDGCAVLMRRLE
jgi:hypothetical protein